MYTKIQFNGSKSSPKVKGKIKKNIPSVEGVHTLSVGYIKFESNL